MAITLHARYWMLDCTGMAFVKVSDIYVAAIAYFLIVNQIYIIFQVAVNVPVVFSRETRAATL